jgi:aldose 1-epimerase
MKKYVICILKYLGVLVALIACNGSKKRIINETKLVETQITSSKFDSIIDGKKISLFYLKNGSISASITNYGGRIVGLSVPNKDGKLTDVVLGLGSLKEYTKASVPYFGAIIGRYANRIAKGQFTLDGVKFQTPINNGLNTLHGGTKGFQYVVWDALKLNDSTLLLSYLSKDGEMGFPGDLEIEVTYQLLKNNTFKITYQAITSKKTVINLTNHAFFNLNGEGSGSILNHQIQIFANEYTPVDSTSIPTGKFENVNHTPFDFRKLTAIGKRINDDNKQLKIGNGYDQNFVLVNNGKNKIAAKVIGDQSGIVMDVYTDQPGIQFYTSNFLKGKNTFKNGAKDDFRTAFCLETQHFPDSPNQPNFPSTVLKPGERFSSISYFQFSTTKH